MIGPPIELFAWVGEDESGRVGIKVIDLGVAVSSAVFATRRIAEHPRVLEQIQSIANHLNRPMRLVRCVVEADALRELEPQPQG